MIANLDLFTFDLSKEEMDHLSGLDEGVLGVSACPSALAIAFSSLPCALQRFSLRLLTELVSIRFVDRLGSHKRSVDLYRVSYLQTLHIASKSFKLAVYLDRFASQLLFYSTDHITWTIIRY